MNTYLRIIFYAVLMGVPANFCVAMDVADKKALACAICQEEKEGPKTMLPCSHLFHTACALPWVRRANTCPICRAEISTDEEFKKECNDNIKEKKELNDVIYQVMFTYKQLVVDHTAARNLCAVINDKYEELTKTMLIQTDNFNLEKQQLILEKQNLIDNNNALKEDKQHLEEMNPQQEIRKLDQELGQLQIKNDALHYRLNLRNQQCESADKAIKSQALLIEQFKKPSKAHELSTQYDLTIKELKRRHLFDGFIIPATSLIVPWLFSRDISRGGLIAKGCMSAGIYCLLTPHTISPKMGFFSLEGIKRIVRVYFS